ncbi:uncharacterized protein LOC113352011 [Papaver somniferum]|uniref:uncharacterized protein LOC113352011 n=1 Tax=Papaver somniferum TaxID=3469 RepID=UPI000E6FD7FE|nr:uncharacterized protein LOC113352011 [Papaver somniferum]
MDTRLSRWRCINIFEAARSVMVRNIANAITFYHMTSFKLPDSTIRKMNSSHQKFWRKKKSNKGKQLISWNNVNIPKEDSSLGFRDLHLFNKAFLAKSAWRLCTDHTSDCVKSLQAKYFRDGQVFNIKKRVNSTWSWTSIISELDFIKKYNFWCIFNGQNLLIWKHDWMIGPTEPPIPKNGVTNHG